MKTVELIQYLRPNGEPMDVQADMPDDVAELATDMILTCEVLTTGEVVLYGRRSDQDEEEEIVEMATNGPGPRSPGIQLEKLIRRVAERG